MRSIWSGFISFGLINIPVKVYSGSEEHGLQFDLFHEKDLSHIRYARVCKKEEKEVPWKEVVKGYEYAPGDYVILTNKDFEIAKMAKDQALEILSFCDELEIDPIFFHKPYYLEPGKGGGKPYVLLREALKETSKTAIAKYVFHNKEYYGILKPYDDLIVLNQIRFSDEIRDPSELNIPDTKVSKQEIKMATMLIDQLTGHFEPERYHDTYKERLLDIIKQKAKGKRPKIKKEKPIESTKVVDLMGMLKKSIDQEKKPKRKRKTA